MATGTAAPRPFRVRRNHRVTPDTTTLTLTPLDGAEFPFAPGQFTMIAAWGNDEVPISVSGDPAEPGLLVHTIRDVGAATRALTTSREGDVLLVRGPYGRGWEVADAVGDDVVVIAGGLGLAPLRPMLLEMAARRHSYGRVSLLYGARTPPDLMFDADLGRLRGQFDFDVEVTVDAATPYWRGRVGLVTALIGKANFAPESTTAFICGPEVMMRIVAGHLIEAGVAPDRIRVSLERNMKCGVGLCGHCQLRDLFVCSDGPVLGYDRVAPLMLIREL